MTTPFHYQDSEIQLKRSIEGQARGAIYAPSVLKENQRLRLLCEAYKSGEDDAIVPIRDIFRHCVLRWTPYNSPYLAVACRDNLDGLVNPIVDEVLSSPLTRFYHVAKLAERRLSEEITKLREAWEKQIRKFVRLELEAIGITRASTFPADQLKGKFLDRVQQFQRLEKAILIADCLAPEGEATIEDIQAVGKSFGLSKKEVAQASLHHPRADGLYKLKHIAYGMI